MLSWIGNPSPAARRFLFLDRDGVINRDRPDYVKSWDEVRFYPDALEALRWLHRRDIGTILISNQSALHRGYVGWEEFWQLHQRVVAHIRGARGDILAAFYCPHRPDENCRCRKPSPQMIVAASGIFGVHLESSFMIGDRATDVLAAKRAGCQAVLLERPEAAPTAPPDAVSAQCAPDLRCPSLFDAVLTIFSGRET
jgi:D-glycero-D-manno-heptose 1,7-bisphosphate phosphatase